MGEDQLSGGPALEWNPKREWWLQGTNFLVVVKHHIVKYDEDRGHNCWNVYAYIYPKHWHFPSLGGESLFQDGAQSLPLHAGASYVRAHRDENGVTAYQVGSDYDHLYDDRFRQTTPEDHFPNGTVFRDARELFDWLSSPKVLGEASEPSPVSSPLPPPTPTQETAP